MDEHAFSSTSDRPRLAPLAQNPNWGPVRRQEVSRFRGCCLAPQSESNGSLCLIQLRNSIRIRVILFFLAFSYFSVVYTSCRIKSKAGKCFVLIGDVVSDDNNSSKLVIFSHLMAYNRSRAFTYWLLIKVHSYHFSPAKKKTTIKKN